MFNCILINVLIVRYIPTQSTVNVTAAGKATMTMIYVNPIVRTP